MDINVVVAPDEKGKPLSRFLVEKGFDITMDCGGRGTCGKCKVTLSSGKLDNVEPDENNEVLACKAICSAEGAEIIVKNITAPGLEFYTGLLKNATGKKKVGAAVDIGTTTIAAALVDIETGTVMETASALNPQRSFGADVMSRILAAERGDLRLMQEKVLSAVALLLASLAGGKYVLSKLVVSGNPTMLHIFSGESPVSMGKYPFTPVFLGEKHLKGRDLGIPCEDIVILPSASAFIGSDITAGVVMTGMMHSDKPCILMDIGTNGEMVLSANNKLTAVSTAAGPAFEGAGISCGMGGVAGAICKAQLVNGKIEVGTVDRAKPAGICGSGLIDIIACLLNTDVIDASGYMDEDFVVADKIALTPKDVREFQMAKSAIRSGLETLMNECGITENDIGTLYLAGGLGFYIDPVSAVRTGLIPEGLSGKITAVGNSSLGGAVECLCSDEKMNEIKNVASACSVLQLNGLDEFESNFIGYMMF